MSRIAAGVGLVPLASMGPIARAQAAPPQAYTLKAEGPFADRRMTVSVERDGPRERIELAIDKNAMTSLYDFAAHRVYWIGWSGPGTCSSGRYLSGRAPVDQDPITGTADNLRKLADGRPRQAAGTGAVVGRPVRVEAFVGGKKPAGPEAEPWPTRVWLAEEGGWLLKLEGEGPGGKSMTLLEVTQLTFAQPAGAPLQPPAPCTSTDSEMDDTGLIRAHAEASAEVQATGTADLGRGTTSSTVTRTEGPPPKARAAPLAKVGGLTLSAAEQPHPGPCGTKLQLTGTITVDGPATIRFRLQSSAGGLQFPDGQGGTVTVDGAGSTTLVRDAIASRSLKGLLRLQATVQGTGGHDGPLKTSAAVPFQVTCAAR
jgi:hypothetical protein